MKSHGESVDGASTHEHLAEKHLFVSKSAEIIFPCKNCIKEFVDGASLHENLASLL